jgi:hypothetical protein
MNARHRLEPAAKLAGSQLELLKPGLMGTGGDGRLYIGPAANVPRGAFVVVLANERKVATITVPANPDRMAAFDEIAEYIDGIGTPTDEDRLIAIQDFVRTFGGAPGKQTPAVPQKACQITMGVLFGGPMGREVLVGLDACSNERTVCPVAVGLAGRGLSGKAKSRSGIWPLQMLLAPHVDAIMDEAA